MVFDSDIWIQLAVVIDVFLVIVSLIFANINRSMITRYGTVENNNRQALIVILEKVFLSTGLSASFIYTLYLVNSMEFIESIEYFYLFLSIFAVFFFLIVFMYTLLVSDMGFSNTLLVLFISAVISVICTVWYMHVNR